MGSNAPPRRQDEELAAIDDADFGRLRLMRQYYYAAPHGRGDLKEAHLLSWEGALGRADLSISVRDEGPFPELRPELRAALKRLATEAASFKRDIAARMLDLVRKCAERGDLPPLTLETLDAALVLGELRVEPEHEIFVYIGETSESDETILSDHVIEVRCNLDGTVKSATLAG